MGDVDFNYSNVPFALSCTFDAVLVLAVVAWAARGERPYPRLAVGGAAVLAVLALKGIVMIRLGLNVSFGVIHVLWLDLVVVLPVAGVAVLCSASLRRHRLLAVAGVAALLLVPVGAYASFIEPSRTVVERAEVPLAPERAGDRPVRIAVVADLQFEHLGGHEREAVATVMAQRPDVILITGDIHQGSREQFARQRRDIRALLSRLRAPGGVYAVHGDTEGPEKARRIYAGTGIDLLINRALPVRVNGRALTVAGIQVNYRSAPAVGTVGALERTPGDRDVRILVTHRPDAVYGLRPRSRVDLTVAGHTHGGQFQLPFAGAPKTASHVPRAVGSGGLHTLSGRRLYVSRGIGMERGQAPSLRLGAPPEVSVLTLR
ncbi:MAG TPA: metallophosphoesterase [Thermoleophilaceae bacterium]|nr:metallophosphoesterase [Thermoleophilaceae bacterium]